MRLLKSLKELVKHLVYCIFEKNHSIMTTFLEYAKYILEKVSFDKNLLTKEYNKALSLLKKDEVEKLNLWIKRKGLTAIPIRST